MKITVEVVGGKRFSKGVAHVYIDGELRAKLRTDESYEIEVSQSILTRNRVKPPTEAPA